MRYCLTYPWASELEEAWLWYSFLEMGRYGLMVWLSKSSESTRTLWVLARNLGIRARDCSQLPNS